MAICAVLNCGTRTGPKQARAKRSMKRTHNFPSSPGVREAWVRACGRGENFVPTQQFVVCCRHFTPSDYIRRGAQDRKLKMKKLKPGAIPTLLLPTAEAIVPNQDEVMANVDDHQALLDKIAGLEAMNADLLSQLDQKCVKMTEMEATNARKTADLRLQLDEECVKNTGLESMNSRKDALIADLRLQLDEERAALHSVYSDDEIYRLKNRKSRRKYTAATMKKAILLYYTTGHTGYEMLRSQGQPFPTPRTIRNYMKKIPFSVGTLHAFIEKMKPKVEKMN